MLTYCKFGNFREKFIFANTVKRHICDVKKSRTGHNLPISVNDRVISPIREDLIFTKLRICEVSRKLNSRENFRIYSIYIKIVQPLVCKMVLLQDPQVCIIITV